MVITLVTGIISSLIFQFTEKLLRISTGSDILSISTMAVSASLGYAFGSLLATNLTTKRFATSCTWIVLAMLVLGTFGILFFQWPVLASMVNSFSSSQVLLNILRIAITLPVSSCIGTLFVLLFQTSQSTNHVGKYAMYTLGTGIGYAVTPLLVSFYLVDSIIFSLILGIIFLSILSIKTTCFSKSSENKDLPISLTLFFIAFFSGLSSTTLLQFSTKLVNGYLGNSAYISPIVFAGFFTISGFSSLFWTAQPIRRIFSQQKILQIVLILTSIAPLFSVYLRQIVPAADSLQKAIVSSILLVIIPAFFQGGIFSSILRENSSPRLLSWFTLASSLGSVFSMMVLLFGILPVYGTKGLFFFLQISCIVALLVYSISYKIRRTISSLLCASICLLLPMLIPESMVQTMLVGTNSHDLYIIEGPTGTASVTFKENRSQADLLVNTQYMSFLPYHPRHVSIGIHALSVKNTNAILQLGLGGGGLTDQLLASSTVNHVTVVDWSEELPRLLKTAAVSPIIHDVLYSPKLTLLTQDAVTFLQFPKTKYNVIIDNLSVSNWPGATQVKTVDYFTRISQSLLPDGYFILEANPASNRDYHKIVAGLQQVFPYVYERSYETLVASHQPLTYDKNQVLSIFTTWQPLSDLSEQTAEAYITSPKLLDKEKTMSPFSPFDVRHEYRRFNENINF